jgi:ABC-type lipoprotein release transport system permease subunit
MSPQRLALRTLMLARPRSVLAILLIAACLCLLDLFAGNIASVRVRLEHEAVMGERLGHLSITPSRSAVGRTRARAFSAEDARKIRQLVAATEGVALVVPQMSVAGIAATGQGSTFFHGEGITAAGDTRSAISDQYGDQYGKLDSVRPNGIALSSDHASALGLRPGSNVTLTGVTLEKTAAPLEALVVDIFSTDDFNDSARSLLMPFEMAQTLVDTQRVEKLVVYLADPKRLDAARTTLLRTLHGAKLMVDVHTWQELSPSYQKARSDSELTFDSVAGMVFAVIAATIAATISMNALERRREVATLRALGMHSSGVFLMFAAEALWMALFAVLLSLVGSGLIAWALNRVALSATAQQALKKAPMLVELDFHRMMMAVVTVMAVALLASLAPAFKAARSDVAEGLAPG